MSLPLNKKTYVKHKKKINEIRETFEELHENTLNEIEEKRQIELKKLQEKIKRGATSLSSTQLNSIQKRIKQLKNNDELSNYLLNIHDVLIEKCQPSSNNSNNPNNNNDEEKNNNPNNNNDENNNNDDENNDDENTTITIENPIDLKNFFAVRREESNHGTLVTKYYRMKYDQCINDYSISTKDVYKHFTCDNCQNDLHSNHDEATIVCKQCGLSKDFNDPFQPQWSETCHIQNVYRYKRLFYFIEHLNRFQAKENANIPSTLIQELMVELNKRRINDPNKITPKLIRTILKDLKYTEYYDHINTIIRKLSNKEIPIISEKLQNTLILMFSKTLPPFEKYKHLIPNRNNYLSYPYVIRKLLQIIAEQTNDEQLKSYISYFSLLKSKEKLQAQERGWKKICEDTGFTFYKTI